MIEKGGVIRQAGLTLLLQRPFILALASRRIDRRANPRTHRRRAGADRGCRNRPRRPPALPRSTHSNRIFHRQRRHRRRGLYRPRQADALWRRRSVSPPHGLRQPRPSAAGRRRRLRRPTGRPRVVLCPPRFHRQGRCPAHGAAGLTRGPRPAPRVCAHGWRQHLGLALGQCPARRHRARGRRRPRGQLRRPTLLLGRGRRHARGFVRAAPAPSACLRH